MRTPWFRCDARLLEDPRFTKLPNDSAKVSWIATMGKAKFQRPQGSFESQEHLAAALGKYGRYVPALISVGLLQVDDAGQLHVRSWDKWQSDSDMSTPRVQAFRARKLRAVPETGKR